MGRPAPLWPGCYVAVLVDLQMEVDITMEKREERGGRRERGGGRRRKKKGGSRTKAEGEKRHKKL